MSPLLQCTHIYLYVRLMKRIKRRFEERALEAEAA